MTAATTEHAQGARAQCQRQDVGQRHGRVLGATRSSRGRAISDVEMRTFNSLASESRIGFEEETVIDVADYGGEMHRTGASNQPVSRRLTVGPGARLIGPLRWRKAPTQDALHFVPEGERARKIAMTSAWAALAVPLLPSILGDAATGAITLALVGISVLAIWRWQYARPHEADLDSPKAGNPVMVVGPPATD